jgi:hypothetical protein
VQRDFLARIAHNLHQALTGSAAAVMIAGNSEGSNSSHGSGGSGSTLAAISESLEHMAAAWPESEASNALQPGQALRSYKGSLQPARQLATALLAHWEQRAPAGDQVELAQAAAARSCAYLRCANLGLEGGPAAGQAGSLKCSACRAVQYCGTACSHADWRAGHRRVCTALAAARQAAKESAAAGQGSS